MSYQVNIIGWKPGLKKLELTKAIMAYGESYNLKKAKSLTDSILNKKSVYINCSSQKKADILAKRVKEIKAIVQNNEYAFA
ncbi:MAG: hypothetical protein ACNS60_07930 [Candidatus Cyclobacteriaceae bacterium M2_1C_046]